MDQMIEEFLAESRDNLDTLDRDILLLEKNPSRRDLIDRIFRAAHTIKGSCAFLKLPRLENLAHQTEGMLAAFRDGREEMTPQAASRVLASFDRIRFILSTIADTGEEPEGDDGDLSAMPQGDEALRVSVDVLENLMTTVGELVLARNQMMQDMKAGNAGTGPSFQKIDHLVSQLQQGIAGARMQPVARAWARLPRLVRDTAMELGKNIRLEMTGGETEIDRQLLDVIRDPLTHMIRNAADHGIETAEDRRRAGKPDEGVIRISARHDSGVILITVADDGRGMDVAAIGQRAILRGIARERDIAGMEASKILEFIFMPGFTTLNSAQSISGRGVGMDVVKTNVERIGGLVTIDSKKGRGTMITLRLPLTLAIIPALIVEVDGDRYAIPQSMVREIVRMDKKPEMIGAAPVLTLREKILPLITLSSLFRTGDPGNKSHVVVINAGGRSCGLAATRVIDSQEIVVKPLPPSLSGLHPFAGVTILGDGLPVLILDPNAIADVAGIQPDKESIVEMQPLDAVGKVKLLLFTHAAGHAAVPLDKVGRIEEIAAADIETAGGRLVTQCRGRLLPLQEFSPGGRRQRQTLIVLEDGGRAAGLIADRVIDIADSVLDLQLPPSGDKKILGTALVNGLTTDIIDAGYFLDHAWKGQGEKMLETAERRVLLVDDSPFFCNILTPMLNAEGYQVMTVGDAEQALGLCAAGEKFDVILSDIEMPGMNGFDFARRVRSDGSRWKSTPLLALSAHATAFDVRKGRAAGFDDYITKFDRESLLRSIERTGKVA